MSYEHEFEQVPSDDELDVEGPNEGATGENPEIADEDFDELEDDDGFGNEADDEY
jgi:hypothetical protein